MIENGRETRNIESHETEREGYIVIERKGIGKLDPSEGFLSGNLRGGTQVCLTRPFIF